MVVFLSVAVRKALIMPSITPMPGISEACSWGGQYTRPDHPGDRSSFGGLQARRTQHPAGHGIRTDRFKDLR